MSEELRQVDLFNRAFAACNAPECLLWAESIRRLIIEQARINAITAAADASRYPQPEFSLLAQARRAQHEQMPQFLHAVACQIDLQSSGPDSLRSQVDMWKQFIDGWHISAQAGAQRASAMALTAVSAPAATAAAIRPGPAAAMTPTRMTTRRYLARPPRTRPHSGRSRRSKRQKIRRSCHLTSP